MQYDPVLIADTRSWLLKAANDLRAAEIDLAARPPLYEDILFHCQQAVEKSLKAFLTLHNQPFRKTHSLEEIGETCLAIDSTLREIVDESVPLTEYAWAFRYAGPPETPNIKEAEAAITLARKVFLSVLNRVPFEARP
jgi:HEPN domain-containing protein